jgi:hypothetical protein
MTHATRFVTVTTDASNAACGTTWEICNRLPGVLRVTNASGIPTCHVSLSDVRAANRREIEAFLSARADCRHAN